MAAFDSDSGQESALSSPPSTCSSPLSSPANSPSPPPELPYIPPQLRANPYPSPPASSQQTSRTGSPDGMDSSATTDKDGPPPAKRRRISKERSTEYLDLRSDEVDPEQQAELDQLLHVLHKRQKIVVIAGAGISVSAGIPDFRSSNGLFKSLKHEHKLKGSGKDLFDVSVYKDDTSTSSFHDMVSSMSRLVKDAKPTAFHHMLATIASEDRLLRLYTQNVDSLDTTLGPLKTSIPLRKSPEDGKWPQTIQLHGGLDKMVCSKCHELQDFNPDLFSGPTPPPCEACEEVNNIRTQHEGKRSHGIGRLRPRMVLYNEENPDASAIGRVTQDDLRKRPDAVIVVGTTLRVPGVKRIVREMCQTVRDRRGGVAVWINKDAPPIDKQLEDCFDIIIQGTCDEVAHRAAMRRWDEPAELDECAEVSDDEARIAYARTAEVHLRLPKCTLTHAREEALPSERHFNNSFSPPPMDVTPKKPLRAPGDWSPMPSRTSSVVQSIESDGDSIAVGGSQSSGLLTPTKSQKSSPAKKPLSLNERLKNGGAGKKKMGRPPGIKNGAGKVKASKLVTAKTSKSAIAVPAKKKNVKYIKGPTKPKTSKAPTGLLNTFAQSKKASISTASKSTKAFPSPGKSSPSKLRQVSNASESLLNPVPPQDARNNLSSPSKARGAFFPGLVTKEKERDEGKTEVEAGRGMKRRLSVEALLN